MKGSQVSIVLIMLIVISSLGIISIHFGAVQAATNVIGLINTNTTWTLANSPYSLSGPVGVANNTILTIEPGVVVNLNQFYMKINGTLYARGTNSQNIIFNSDVPPGSNPLGSYPSVLGVIIFSGSMGWDEQSQTGSIIENAQISSSQDVPKIYIEKSYPKIADSIIKQTGTRGSSGMSVASGLNGLFPLILNNTLLSENVGSSGITVMTDANITNNKICGWDVGIYVGGNSSPIIQGNLIVHNGRNLMSGDSGIRIDSGSPDVENNTITQNIAAFNIIGTSGMPTTKIVYNNIFSNTQYSIYLYPPAASGDVNATYNWWGTTNTATIEQSIYDVKDDFNLGLVTYLPFYGVLNSQAPEVPQFTISATAQTGGSISPNGDMTANYGDSETFDITANVGYHIVDVTVNGASKGAVTQVTINHVIQPYAINAIFAPDPTPTPSPSPSPSPSPAPTASPTPSPSPSPSPTPTASPTPSPTPTASPSPSPTPMPTPTATPVPQYTIRIIHLGEGTVNPTDGNYLLNYESTLTIQATPTAGYTFAGWLQNGTQLSTSNSVAYTVTNNYVLTAVFYNQGNTNTPTPTTTTTPAPSNSPSPTENPTSTPSPTTEPSPTANPTPLPTLEATVEPTEAPTAAPSNTPNAQTNDTQQQSLTRIAIPAVIIAIICIALVLILRNRR